MQQSFLHSQSLIAKVNIVRKLNIALLFIESCLLLHSALIAFFLLLFRDTNLAMYSSKTVLLTLPDGQHWSDYEWFTVYSFAVNQSFVDIDIPFHVSNKLPVHNPTSDVHKGGGK